MSEMTLGLDGFFGQTKMDMRFGMWNAKDLYRAVWSWKVAKEISKCKWEYDTLNGTGVAPNQQANIHFSIESGMRIKN
jgi:hypothetical protein